MANRDTDLKKSLENKLEADQSVLILEMHNGITGLPIFNVDEKIRAEIFNRVEAIAYASFISHYGAGVTRLLDYSERNITEAFNKFLLAPNANPSLKALSTDSKIKHCLIQMICHAEFMFSYLKKGDTARKYEFMRKLRKEILFLQKELGDKASELLNVMMAANNFLSIVPLAVSDIQLHDRELKPFIEGELFARHAAYRVGENPGQYKTLEIFNAESKKVQESFSIQEICVMKEDGKGGKERDKVLMGAIYTRKEPFKENEVPTINITWMGTKSEQTARADAEKSAGQSSFLCGVDQIIKQILLAIHAEYLRSGKPVQVVINGHSLGGALTGLTLHTLQRVLALNIAASLANEDKTKQEIITSEAAFHIGDGIVHHSDLSTIRFDPKEIADIRIGTYNSTGISNPVMNHSNKLGIILLKHGCGHEGYFGMVMGDAVQMTGEGAPLSSHEIVQAGAKLHLMMADPHSRQGFAATSLGMMGSVPYGAGIAAAAGAGPIGISITAAGFAAGFVAATTVSKVKLHCLKHFEDGIYPEHAFALYASHNVNGEINKEHCNKILSHILDKSQFNILGARFLSNLMDTTGAEKRAVLLRESERFAKELVAALGATDSKTALDNIHASAGPGPYAAVGTPDKVLSPDITEQTKFLALFNLLHKEMVTKPLGFEARIAEVLISGLLPIIVKDAKGKTIIDYAFENQLFPMIITILSNIPYVGVDANLTPILLGMIIKNEKIDNLLHRNAITSCLGDNINVILEEMFNSLAKTNKEQAALQVLTIAKKCFPTLNDKGKNICQQAILNLIQNSPDASIVEIMTKLLEGFGDNKDEKERQELLGLSLRGDQSPLVQAVEKGKSATVAMLLKLGGEQDYVSALQKADENSRYNVGLGLWSYVPLSMQYTKPVIKPEIYQVLTQKCIEMGLMSARPPKDTAPRGQGGKS